MQSKGECRLHWNTILTSFPTSSDSCGDNWTTVAIHYGGANVLKLEKADEKQLHVILKLLDSQWSTLSKPQSTLHTHTHARHTDTHVAVHHWRQDLNSHCSAVHTHRLTAITTHNGAATGIKPTLTMPGHMLAAIRMLWYVCAHVY